MAWSNLHFVSNAHALEISLSPLLLLNAKIIRQEGYSGTVINLREDVMKAMKRKDTQIQKLRDVCAQLNERVIKLEAENSKLKKKLKK